MQAYPDYHESGEGWIGTIPSHWEKNKFKFLLTEKKKTQNIDIPCGAISFGRVVYKDSERLTEETKLAYQEVLSGEFLVNPINLNYDLKSLRTALSDIDVIVSSGYIVLQNLGFAVSEYLKWLLHVFDVRHMKTLGAGIRQTITFKDIGNCITYLPPLDEQSVIAGYLDRETARIDNLIAEKQNFINLLKEKRQALISHVVTKGLDPKVKMKDSGIEWIGEVPEHWRSKRIDSLYRQTKRQGYESLEVLSVYRELGVIRKSSRDDNINKTPENLTTYQLVEKGDLVINKMKAWQGSLGVSEHEGITSPDYVVYSSLHAECDEFIHYSLRAQHMHSFYLINSNGIRIGQWRLETDKFKCLHIFLPPLEEQVEIVRFLAAEHNRINSLIDEVDKSIELLSEHRTALISAAVTGKIDVRNA